MMSVGPGYTTLTCSDSLPGAGVARGRAGATPGRALAHPAMHSTSAARSHRTARKVALTLSTRQFAQ